MSNPEVNLPAAHDDALLQTAPPLYRASSMVTMGSLSLQDSKAGLSAEQLDEALKAMRDFSSGELDGLLGIDFAVWNWSKPQLYGICLGMFVRNGLIPSSTALARLLDFIVDMAAGYFDNAYHSFLHAVDVTYMVYWSLVDLELAEKLQFSTVDFVAILIAALAHDVLHPGFNNLYQINAKTDVASKYDNKSVLEMQSCDHLSALLAKHSCLSGLEYGEVASHLVDIPKIIENIAIEAILHTDMCHHFELLEKLSFTAEEVIGPTDDSVESVEGNEEGGSDGSVEEAPPTSASNPRTADASVRHSLIEATIDENDLPLPQVGSQRVSLSRRISEARLRRSLTPAIDENRQRDDVVLDDVQEDPQAILLSKRGSKGRLRRSFTNPTDDGDRALQEEHILQAVTKRPSLTRMRRSFTAAIDENSDGEPSPAPSSSPSKRGSEIRHRLSYFENTLREAPHETSEEKLGQSESDEVPGELRMTQSPSFAKSESREGLMSAESLNAADAKPDDSVLEPPSSDDSNQGEGLAMVGVITPQHRQIMTNAILHAADISNAARPLEICKRWADMVAEEFFLQGEQERRTGLPVTPSMDRDSISPAQIGFDFNTYIARPYFEVLAEIFPTTRCLAENLISNRNTWENMGASARPPASGAAAKSNGDKPADDSTAESDTSNSTRGRRLSLAAGTIEIPQAYDIFVMNAAKRYRHRYKTSRSLSSGRSRGISPLLNHNGISSSMWAFRVNDSPGDSNVSLDSSEASESNDDLTDNVAQLSILATKRRFPARRCMSMDAQATDPNGVLFQRWNINSFGGARGQSVLQRSPPRKESTSSASVPMIDTASISTS